MRRMMYILKHVYTELNVHTFQRRVIVLCCPSKQSRIVKNYLFQFIILLHLLFSRTLIIFPLSSTKFTLKLCYPNYFFMDIGSTINYHMQLVNKLLPPSQIICSIFLFLSSHIICLISHIIFFGSGPYISLIHSYLHFIIKLIPYASRTYILLTFSTHFSLQTLKLMPDQSETNYM